MAIIYSGTPLNHWERLKCPELYFRVVKKGCGREKVSFYVEVSSIQGCPYRGVSL